MSEPTRCKDCIRDGVQTIRPATNPGPRCVTHWRDEKKRRTKAAHDKKVQATYGLAPGEYDVLYAWQRGRCAICRVATGRTRRLSVDHDHATGLVRGLICRPCNDALGQARDKPEYFDRAAAYLRDHPYARFKRGGVIGE